jgi:hypothetical protein
MGMRVAGYVGPNYSLDGNAPDMPFRFGSDGALIVSQSHGRYYHAAKRGQMFVASSSTPLTLKVDTGLVNNPTLWNPMGSGVVLELVRMELTQTITTPAAPSAFEWFSGYGGSDIGTLAPMTVFTNIAPVNMLIGSGKVSKARYSQVNTWTVGQRAVYLCGAGISQDTWAATATYPPFRIAVDYDGMLVVPPGQAIYLCGTVATVTTFFVNYFYIESPYYPVSNL